VRTDPSGSDDPAGPSSRERKRTTGIFTGPTAAAVGLVGALMQIFDYLQDGKVGLLGLAIVALAAVWSIAVAWRARRRIAGRAASMGLPEAVVVGSALVGALSLVAVAVTTVLAAGPPGPVPQPPPIAVTPPSGSATATQGPSAPSVSALPPLAGGVSCGPATAGPVTITSVHSADGRPEMGSDVVVTLTVPTPPAGASYWLMAYADDVPRNLYFVWSTLTPGQPVVQHIIRSGAGSHRKIFVAQSSATSEGWFVENLRQDRNSSWDGNRVDMPPDVQTVSNPCDVVRMR